MAVSFDRRRINGPEDSRPLIYEDDAGSDLKTAKRSRRGRDPKSIRPICSTLSFQHLFTRSDVTQIFRLASLVKRTVRRISKQRRQKWLAQCEMASQYWLLDSLREYAFSYGPRQIKNAPYNEMGKLNVEVKFAPFSCSKRRAPLRVNVFFSLFLFTS